MFQNGGDEMGFLDGLFKKKEEPTAGTEKHVVASPVKGRVIPLKEVPDPAFAEGILGVGVAVIPAEGSVYAPVDGTVAAAFPTGHAVGLQSDDGMEVLIHVGIDTVSMKGEGFCLKVSQGDKVKRGDLLLTFDARKIEEAGHETTTMVLVSNAANLGTLEVLSMGDVDVLQKLYCLG